MVFFNSHLVNQYTERTVRPVLLCQMEEIPQIHTEEICFVCVFVFVCLFLLPCSQPIHRADSTTGTAVSDGSGPGKYHRYTQKELVFCFVFCFVSFLTPMQSTNIQSGQHGQYGYIRRKGAREMPQIQTGVTCYLLCLFTPMQSANTQSGQHGQYGYI